LPKIVIDIAINARVKILNIFNTLGGKNLTIPEAFLSPGKPIRWPNDGCHPNDYGYSLIAKKVAKDIVDDVVMIIKKKLT
jgi:lysophospholipase L1-like esterase